MKIISQLLLKFVSIIRILGEAMKYNLVLKILAHIQYVDDYWVENFKMSKSTFFKIVERLKPIFMKQNMKYLKAKHVEVHVSYVIYKLAHNCNFFICNKLLVIGKSSIILIILLY